MQGDQRDARACLELFRRAIVTADQAAWAAIYEQYRALVRHWLGDVRDVDDLVQETFARLHQKLTPERFSSGRFPKLGSVLRYMRVIAVNLSIDQKRRIERERRALGWRVEPREDDSESEGPQLTDDHASDGLENAVRQELFDLLRRLIPDEKEWLVITLSYEYELSPREIAALHPELFRDAAEVSTIKERVKKRLRRDPTLKEYSGPESENITLRRSVGW